MGIDRSRPNPALLQKWLRELDIPMDEHPAMIDAVDWLQYRNFVVEIAVNPESRAD